MLSPMALAPATPPPKARFPATLILSLNGVGLACVTICLLIEREERIFSKI